MNRPPEIAPPGVIVTDVTLPVKLKEEDGAVVVVPALPQRFPLESNTMRAITYPPDIAYVTAVVSVAEKSPYSKTIDGAKYAFPRDVIVVAMKASF